MKLKRLICFALALVLSLPLFACTGKDKNTVHVYMPDGAPAIALASFMNSGYDGADFTVVPAATIAAQVSSGAADMAIMPVNGAAGLYNKGTKIVMLSVNTHGNLFIVGNEENISLADLVGHKLGAIGKGGVPEYTLRILLDNAGISYTESAVAVPGKIAITYAEDGGELIPLFNEGAVDYALLGEPAVTNALSKPGRKVAVDIQQAWSDAFDGEYPQACLVAKSSLVEKSPEFVKKFLSALKLSDGWAKTEPDKTLKAVKANMQKGTQTTLKALTSETIERCNIKTVYAAEAKAACVAYFQKLTQIKTDLDKPALGKLPDDGFYYSFEK